MLKITPVESDINFSEAGPVESSSATFWESEYGKRLKK
jgi:hypothetical protein